MRKHVPSWMKILRDAISEDRVRYRRNHVVNRFRFTVFLAAVILTVGMIGGIMIGSFDAEGSSITAYEEITIQNGDTLWEIAQNYKPADQAIRDFIYEICDYNNISAGEIYQGQNIMIPISK